MAFFFVVIVVVVVAVVVVVVVEKSIKMSKQNFFPNVKLVFMRFTHHLDMFFFRPFFVSNLSVIAPKRPKKVTPNPYKKTTYCKLS